MVAYAPMVESDSNRFCSTYGVSELQRGAFPLGLPTDGLPRSEALSQLIHLKSLRAQRELYPRADFQAALEIAALHGLECYRCLRRSFLGMDHIPIALVPRGSNVIVALIPAVLSQATDAVLASGHRLYFEVEGGLQSINEDEDEEDEPSFGLTFHNRSMSSGGCSRSRSNAQKQLMPSGLAHARSGSLGGDSRCDSGSRCITSSGKVTAWMPCAGDGTPNAGVGVSYKNGGCNGPADASLPKRRGSGSAVTSACTISQQSFSSLKSSASSSFRSLRSVLSARYTSNRALTSSELEIYVTKPRVAGDSDDDQVTLMNGCRFSIDKLAVAISVFADRENGVQAFRQELIMRGFHVSNEHYFRAAKMGK